MDKDNDSKISQDEAPEELKENFGYIDTNGDGLMDAKEAEVILQYVP